MKASILLALIIPMAMISCSSCGSQAVVVNDSTTRTELIVKEETLKYEEILQIEGNKTIRVRKDLDLGGKIVLVPEGVTLVPSGGLFKNGTLIGNKTKINGDNTLFDNVRIKGTWVKENITTDLFASLDYENSLRDVLALASPDVMNNIEIKDGEYWVSALSFQSALDICSNTVLVIDGTIELVPNNLKGCFVVQVKDADNVTIKGNGSIVGDKKEHKGVNGEWGHGIYVIGSNRVLIQDLCVSNCWGDCIYVGGKSANITIKNCNLNEGRRQGISVTSADSVRISNCFITNVYGTAPQYGIDIEPNKGRQVDNIIIEDVTIDNCYGGIMSWRPDDASIGNIIIRRCKVTGTKTAHPIHMRLSDRIAVEDCEVISDTEDCIVIESVGFLFASGNKMTSRSENPFLTKRVKKENVSDHTIISK